MRRFRQTILTLGIICALSSAPLDLRAEAVTLSIDESRILATQMLGKGQVPAARQIALKLLERDPKDRIALVVLSRAERLLQNYGAAASAGKKAWSVSETDEQKYTAALLVAQAKSADGNKLAGQLWLRRAVQVAPNGFARAKAISDFRFLRSTNPYSLKFYASVAPSNNINNGATAESVDIRGLSFLLSGDARALSGLEYRLGANLSYRYNLSDRSRLTFGAALDTRTYTLSSSAKRSAPDARAGDYAFQELRFSTTWQVLDADKKGLNTASLTLGSNWYGGNSLTNFLNATASRRYALNDNNIVTFTLGGERQWRQDEDARSATVWTLQGNWIRKLKGGNTLSVTAFGSDTSSSSPAIGHKRVGADLRYIFAKPIFGKTQLELNAGVEARDYDQTLGIFGVREDRTTRLGATMVFNDVDYFGFVPTAEVTAQNTNSTSALWETSSYGVRFGLRSSF